VAVVCIISVPMLRALQEVNSSRVASSQAKVRSFAMLVADLRHFLDLPNDAPGPARRLA
jgi:hypothetical protein